MANLQLSVEQEQGTGLAVAALRDLRKHFRLGGYAGTGKTTLISHVVDQLSTNYKKVLVMAPTGKAANVLTNKGVPASTIHRQLYELTNDKPITFKLRDFVEADFFVIDEASMISVELYEDILSFNKPTLFVGDPAQLEPVGNDAKLMQAPDFVLRKIHRTAEDSNIIKFATQMRSGAQHPAVLFGQKFIPAKAHDFAYGHISTFTRAAWLAFDQIIVGKNITRNKFNQTFRKGGAHSPYPVQGDKLICLKNEYAHGIFNGETFTCINSEFEQNDQTGDLQIQVENDAGQRAWYPFWLEFFNDQTLEPWKKPKDVVHLDFAYAITCHKSQGSEWDNVCVVDEAFGTPPNRWRYTAATRAAKHLTWVRP